MTISIFKKFFFLVLFALVFSASFASEVEKTQQPNPYNGPIYNIFFHPLIAYPKLAFDASNKHLNYIDNWFVTTREFNKILPDLYAKGFILYSPKDLFEEKKDDKGQLIITRKTIFLSPGKKPLILSLDDYNFYNNMKLHGTIHRFWVDPNKKLATITNINANQAIVRYDQEIPQLLEDFIAKHPDFSHNNARGIIALTGYNGIFGYNTHMPFALNYPLHLQEAKKVVKKLKEMGWEFGSHSYFHQSLKKQTPKAFELSERRWLKEVGSLVGPSPYYIFPFGDPWDQNPTRLKTLKLLGYKYFFGVCCCPELTMKSGAVVMNRFPMDGMTLRKHPNQIDAYINVTHVFDVDRPLKLQPPKKM